MIKFIKLGNGTENLNHLNVTVIATLKLRCSIFSTSRFFFIKGMCVVPPVIRANANAPKRKGDTDVRCEACWLKLCLIGYNLETALYDRLRYVST